MSKISLLPEIDEPLTGEEPVVLVHGGRAKRGPIGALVEQLAQPYVDELQAVTDNLADALAELQGPAYQAIGIPQAPVNGNTATPNTRIITTPSAQDSILAEVRLWAKTDGTVTVKVYPVTASSGGIATSVGAATTSISVAVTTGDFTISQAAMKAANGDVDVSVPANSVVAVYAATNILVYPSTPSAGTPAASLVGDNTAGGALAAGNPSFIWQISASLEYQEQYVTADRLRPIVEGTIAAASVTVAGLSAHTGTRAIISDFPTGAILVNKVGDSWRDGTGRVLSSAVGACAVAGVYHYFSAGDCVGKQNLISSWSDQAGTITLNETGSAPGYDRAGIHALTGRTPKMVAAGIGTQAAIPVATIRVPDGSAYPLPSGGFTSTGLDRLSSGEWLVGNHGTTKIDTAGDNPTHGTLVLVDPSFTKIVLEIDWFGGRLIKSGDIANATSITAIAGIGSIQGVAAIDTETFWFTDTLNADGIGNNKLWKSNRAGAQLDSITISTLAPDTARLTSAEQTQLATDLATYNKPNGLAYNPTEDGLWVTLNNSSGTASPRAYLINLTSKQVVKMIGNITTSADQLIWDDIHGYLGCTTGANGTDCSIAWYDSGHCRLVAMWNLPNSRAIEGAVLEKRGDGVWVVWAVNDTGFHVSSGVNRPTVSVLQQYEVTPYPPAVYSDVLTIGLAIRKTATVSGAQVILAEGDPTLSNINGWALMLTSTGLQVQMRMNGDASITTAAWTIADLQKTAFTKAVIRIDRASGTATMLIGGTLTAATVTGSIASLAHPFIIGGRLTVYSLQQVSTPRALTSADCASICVGGDCVAADVATYLDAETMGLAA